MPPEYVSVLVFLGSGLLLMDSRSVVDMIEASSRAHFSGFHLIGLQHTNVGDQGLARVSENIPRQPFIIGNYTL